MPAASAADVESVTVAEHGVAFVHGINGELTRPFRLRKAQTQLQAVDSFHVEVGDLLAVLQAIEEEIDEGIVVSLYTMEVESVK